MEQLARDRSFSYLKIPAPDPRASARFYQRVFGWAVERPDSDRPSFVDGSGHLAGSWEIGQVPTTASGLLPYIYVDRIDDVTQRIEADEGVIVDPPYPEGDLWVAHFRDPAGNVMGIWHAGDR